MLLVMMIMKLKCFGLLVLVLLSFCSCSSFSNDRRLKKFVSRFNAKEYACASTYIYPDDRMQLAFFANEVMNNVSNAFIEIEESETKDDYMVAKLKWKNANDFLRNYFANIGKPLLEGDVLVDTLKIRETLDGDCFSFDWGSPELNKEKLRLASISAENVEQMNIRADAGKRARIIGKLEKGDDILIEDEGKGWSRCYLVNDNSQVQRGYIYTANMSVKESAFFTLGIFDSMSLLVAVIVILIIIVPLYYISSLATGLFGIPVAGPVICIGIILGCLYVVYQLIEKILFELFIINLPY